MNQEPPIPDHAHRPLNNPIEIEEIAQADPSNVQEVAASQLMLLSLDYPLVFCGERRFMNNCSVVFG